MKYIFAVAITFFSCLYATASLKVFDHFHNPAIPNTTNNAFDFKAYTSSTMPLYGRKTPIINPAQTQATARRVFQGLEPDGRTGDFIATWIKLVFGNEAFANNLIADRQGIQHLLKQLNNLKTNNIKYKYATALKLWWGDFSVGLNGALDITGGINAPSNVALIAAIGNLYIHYDPLTDYYFRLNLDAYNNYTSLEHFNQSIELFSTVVGRFGLPVTYTKSYDNWSYGAKLNLKSGFLNHYRINGIARDQDIEEVEKNIENAMTNAKPQLSHGITAGIGALYRPMPWMDLGILVSDWGKNPKMTSQITPMYYQADPSWHMGAQLKATLTKLQIQFSHQSTQGVNFVDLLGTLGKEWWQISLQSNTILNKNLPNLYKAQVTIYNFNAYALLEEQQNTQFGFGISF